VDPIAGQKETGSAISLNATELPVNSLATTSTAPISMRWSPDRLGNPPEIAKAGRGIIPGDDVLK